MVAWKQRYGSIQSFLFMIPVLNILSVINFFTSVFLLNFFYSKPWNIISGPGGGDWAVGASRCAAFVFLDGILHQDGHHLDGV